MSYHKAGNNMWEVEIQRKEKRTPWFSFTDAALKVSPTSRSDCKSGSSTIARGILSLCTIYAIIMIKLSITWAWYLFWNRNADLEQRFSDGDGIPFEVGDATWSRQTLVFLTLEKLRVKILSLSLGSQLHGSTIYKEFKVLVIDVFVLKSQKLR